MKREDVCRQIEEVGVLPVVRSPSAELAARAAEALVAGGLHVLEITMTVPGAVRLIGELSARFRDRAIVGAGTVLDKEKAAECIDAGARFIVSPGLDLPTIARAHAYDVAVMPGALTPTEIITAWKAGADFVKIFPCSALGGARYLKLLRGPLPDVKFLPTGGVNVSTAAEFIEAGASAVGVGSELVDVGALRDGRDTVVTERARELRAAVAQGRAKLAASRVK
jgi:2-dehydro-3-deoxyphosphogluconate aldolase/(4S)-4-hydroxy-2-oxoglutarate aldolase